MISPQMMRAALGETRASYPVPFLAGTLCGSALIVLILAGVSLPEGSAGFWAFVAIASVLFGCAVGMVGYALLRRPELLRDERTVIVERAIELYGNDEIGDMVDKRIAHTVDRYLDRHSAPMEGPLSRKRSLANPQADKEDEDG